MSKMVEIVIYPEIGLGNVSRYLYSHFAEHLGRCIYGGIWVGKDSKIENNQGIRCDTVKALKKLALPALRWPGGCFADTYHWMDGIGPADQRPRRHNLWWRQPEMNQFGTDEFMRLCRMVDSEPYICLNVGSGTVEEALRWVEYCNSDQPTSVVKQRQNNGHPKPYDVKFWGIGNENWLCGGSMRPEYYADLYRRYATYLREIAGERAKLIACGSYDVIPEWDARFLELMKDALGLVDYIALHIYSRAGSDVNFTDEDYYRLIASIDVMNKNLTRASGLAQAYSSYGHPIGVVLDEWGTWYKEAKKTTGHYQQNTMQDALFTAASFHCFHRHADNLFMTNMAQTVNVQQALILTKGPEMIVTPTYYVYEMFQPHRSGQLVTSNVNAPLLKLPEGQEQEAISVSATRSADSNELFLSIVNLDLQKDFTGNIRVSGENRWKIKQVRRLAAKDIHAHNSFEESRRVYPKEISLEGAEEQDAIELPRQSITTVGIKILHSSKRSLK